MVTFLYYKYSNVNIIFIGNCKHTSANNPSMKINKK